MIPNSGNARTLAIGRCHKRFTVTPYARVVPTFEVTVLANGDWFADMEQFDDVLKFAAEHDYGVALPSFADEDSDLYGILVRHKLKDIYIVPSVVELPSAEA